VVLNRHQRIRGAPDEEIRVRRKCRESARQRRRAAETPSERHVSETRSEEDMGDGIHAPAAKL
jgi:hypothetical protein